MTQRDTFRVYFQARPYQDIPVYDLAKLGLQYNARIYELRGEGMKIELTKNVIVAGQRHTCYTYLPDGQRRLFQ